MYVLIASCEALFENDVMNLAAHFVTFGYLEGNGISIWP